MDCTFTIINVPAWWDHEGFFRDRESRLLFLIFSKKKKKKNLRICLIWLHFLPTALITDLADCKLDLIIKALLSTVAERLALKRRYWIQTSFNEAKNFYLRPQFQSKFWLLHESNSVNKHLTPVSLWNRVVSYVNEVRHDSTRT